MASDGLPPPSYASRTPPRHRSGPSNKKSYKIATNLDTEDGAGQLSETAQPSYPKRNVAKPEEPLGSQAYFSDEEEFSDEYCPARGKGMSRCASYSDEELPGDEEYPAKGKGKSRRTRYADESDEGRNLNREDLNRALMHRKDTRPTEGLVDFQDATVTTGVRMIVD